MGPVAVGAKRIVSSRFQVAPRAKGAFATIAAERPLISIRLRVPAAKNPIERLSGDQKGNTAPSVPDMGRPDTESSERSHSCNRPSSVAAKTIFWPSGESANESGSDV